MNNKQHTSIDNVVDVLIGSMDMKAAIFDLDGTLIDNNQYHLIAWKQYLKDHGIEVSEEEYKKNFNGRTNKDVIIHIYGNGLSEEEITNHALEKEAVYRDIYTPHIKPVDGLLELLESLHRKNIPMAIATSGIQVNIDFMFDHLPIKKYFGVVLNSAHIKKGKPDPEIYMKTAAALGIVPGNCVVFEDAAVGVTAAKLAGMPVIAITTTQPREELKEANLIVKSFIPEEFMPGLA